MAPHQTAVDVDHIGKLEVADHRRSSVNHKFVWSYHSDYKGRQKHLKCPLHLDRMVARPVAFHIPVATEGNPWPLVAAVGAPDGSRPPFEADCALAAH